MADSDLAIIDITDPLSAEIFSEMGTPGNCNDVEINIPDRNDIVQHPGYSLSAHQEFQLV